jgi:cell division protein FtsI (penicillin-binding protein 3)
MMRFQWPWARAAKNKPRRNARRINYATSPLLASKTPPWRSRFVVVLLALAFTILVGKAIYVQIVYSGFYQKQGEMRYARTLTLPASRGRILDRNGAVLATSVPTPSVWAIPKDFQATAAQRKALGKLLDLSPAELQERTEGDSEFSWLRRQVDQSVWEQVKALGIAGVHQLPEYKRKYPEGEAAAHVVGFTGIEGDGLEGIEYEFRKELQGRNGSRGVVRDRFGRVVEDNGERVDPINGQDIVLSIDSEVQFFAWKKVRDAVKAHNAQAGSVVVLDAKSGEVLALANYPSFDPSRRYAKGSPLLRNRALTDIFEPGSTMKPFIASWSMETKRVTPQTVLNTTPFQITGHTIRDDHPHPQLSVAEVIQKSSNVGTVKMAMQMDRKEMWELLSQVGFGQRPQLDFPGAVTGRLRPWKTWRPIEQATMAYGYGVSTSLFQLARAYTVFARDGEVVPISIRKHDMPPSGLRVLSPRTAQDMRRMLSLVTQPGGTAPKAQAIGYSVGGKTGTARKIVGKDYATNKYRAWFVGLAPVSDPRIVVAVMVDEPSKGVFFGGEVAAPVFSEVVQHTLRTLGVAPDIEVKPQIQVKPGDTAVESF